MSSSIEPKMLSMEFSTAGRSDCHFRIQAGQHVKYITITAGTLDAMTLLDMPSDFASILPLDFCGADWNTARISRSAVTNEMEAACTRSILPGVEDLWHDTRVDFFDLKKVENLSLLTEEYTWTMDKKTKKTLIGKMARFPWEIPALAAETRMYKHLARLGLGPTFLGHVVENGRIIGFALEKLHGRRHAGADDVDACREELGRFHAQGILHGDVNRYKFLVDDEGGSATLVDFAEANVGAEEGELEEEMGRLGRELAESEDEGEEGEVEEGYDDDVIYEVDEED